MIVIIDIYTYI